MRVNEVYFDAGWRRTYSMVRGCNQAVFNGKFQGGSESVIGKIWHDLFPPLPSQQVHLSIIVIALNESSNSIATQFPISKVH